MECCLEKKGEGLTTGINAIKWGSGRKLGELGERGERRMYI